MAERRTIVTDYLARVEGEGAMTVRLDGNEVEHVELRIFEPPRFFEAFLRGRSFLEAPDVTARICGICPVAYQTSAVNALESLCGVEVPEPIRLLRRLLYCGEWIESHALHVYMLHAPDFLGYESAIELARDAPEAVERGLALKRTGNEVMTLVGGREIHPINVRVGGFYRVPSRRELRALVEPLERAREAALETVRWTAGFEFPERTVDCDLVALAQPGEYAIERGRIRSSGGLDLAPAEYDEHFEELHVERSNALQSQLRGGGTYLCGPLARYTLGSAELSPLAREA
ncbi:MAG TPA: nickel-dependent hydrogenase large subunit, partial [Gaiellaceae bacterium]|nr:nickel-dependent hydrogenase large subunit [Gaiellaceae bacterium]